MTNNVDVIGDSCEDDVIELEISEDEEDLHTININMLFDILENFDVYGERQ